MVASIETIEDAIFSVSRQAMLAILRRDSASDRLWAHRLKTIRAHGLTSFNVESPFAKPLEVDNSRLGDYAYKRHILRRLQQPRPSKWMHVELPLDREKLMSDEKYLSDMATVLGYKLMRKLTPIDCAVVAVLLLRLDEHNVTDMLDDMGNHEADAEGMSDFILRSLAEDLVDSHPVMKAALAELRAQVAVMQAEMKEEIRQICQESMANLDAKIQAILEEMREHFDELDTLIRANYAEQAKKTQEILDASRKESEGDPQEQFAAAVERRLRNRDGTKW